MVLFKLATLSEEKSCVAFVGTGSADKSNSNYQSLDSWRKRSSCNNWNSIMLYYLEFIFACGIQGSRIVSGIPRLPVA